jgi:hypothetical protein
MSPADLTFVRLMGILFTRNSVEKLDFLIDDWVRNLDAHIARLTRGFQEAGYYTSISLFCALMGFGLDQSDSRPDNLFLELLQDSEPANMQMLDIFGPQSSPTFFNKTLDLVSRTLDVVLQRVSDVNILHFAHCSMVFIFHVCHHRAALDVIAPSIPWNRFANLLNTLLLERPDLDTSRFAGNTIPVPERESVAKPLPEDHAMRAISFTTEYYPPRFFSEQITDDDKYFELASMMEVRKDRILSLGFRITRVTNCLLYESRQFRPHPRYGVEYVSHLRRGRGEATSEVDTEVSAFSTGDIATPSSSGDEVMVDTSS